MKIKKFAKEYIAKVLRRLDKSSHSSRPRPSSSTTTQTSPSLDTPNSAEGRDGTTADVSMSVEEAMDMEPDSDDNEYGDNEERAIENGIEVSDLTGSVRTSPLEPKRDGMDVDDFSGHPWDPRRRPPEGCRDPGWGRGPQPHRVNGVSARS